MTIYNWLCLLGIPSAVATIVSFILARLKKMKSDQDALKSGVQALLRQEMIKDYNKWSEKGYAPIYVRENFINVYEQYHSLGANGVMDDMKDKFMQLPIK